jgi:hypothetical protein
VARVVPIEGIKAVALGGSRARGTAREDSDIDLGLYYEPDAPFRIEALDAAGCELDDRHTSGLMTPFGGWGAGVNGGGWLCIGARRVDLLYRDLDRVRTVIEQCPRGEIDGSYQLGHPLGFQNQIYAGEVHICQPLHDPADELALLKQLVAVYPPRMRRTLVDEHLFDAQFEIQIAAGPAARGDVVYVSQCLARATGFMVLSCMLSMTVSFSMRKTCLSRVGAFRSFPIASIVRSNESWDGLEIRPLHLREASRRCAQLGLICVVFARSGIRLIQQQTRMRRHAESSRRDSKHTPEHSTNG